MAEALDGGGGEFQGINPGLLATLMGSMKSGVGAAQPAASGYVGQFSRLGVDTSTVNRLLQDYTWAQAQQPMLQRRYNLASHQPSGQWVGGMATSGAGDLLYTTSGQAQTAGANAAKQYRDGKITEAEFLSQLREHQGDPDWQTGAMRQLGTEGLWQISQEGIPPDSDQQASLQALASAVAVAMANGVRFPDEDSDDPDSVAMEQIAPLLQYANFPPKVLAQLGKEAMAPGYARYSPMVWNALAKNPEGAALFIKDNAPDIMEYVKAGDHRGGLPDDYQTAFTNMLKAGTVGIKATDPKLGAQAVTQLVKAANQDPGQHVPGQMQSVFGQVVQAYWPDVMFAVTSKAVTKDNTGKLTPPDGMQLSSADWAPFIQEAMRDPKTSTALLYQAHAQAKEWQNTGSQQAGGPWAGDSYNFDAGLVSGYFDYQAKQTYDALVKEGGDAAKDWKEQASDYVGDASGLVVDIVADPGEGIVKPVAKKLSEIVLTDTMTSIVNGIPTGADKVPDPDFMQWQGAYSQDAQDVFNNSTTANLTGKDADLRSALYQSAARQPFVVKDPTAPLGYKIKDPDSMTPAQLTAYNTWLSSPAVANYVLYTGGTSAYLGGYNTEVLQQNVFGAPAAGGDGG